MLCVRVDSVSVDIVREYEGLRGQDGCGNVECRKARGGLRIGGFEERGVDTNGDCCANATMMTSL